MSNWHSLREPGTSVKLPESILVAFTQKSPNDSCHVLLKEAEGRLLCEPWAIDVQRVVYVANENGSTILCLLFPFFLFVGTNNHEPAVAAAPTNCGRCGPLAPKRRAVMPPYGRAPLWRDGRQCGVGFSSLVLVRQRHIRRCGVVAHAFEE